MKIGNLVQIDLGLGTVQGDTLRYERRFAWGIITEIRREGERLMVHFIKDDRKFLIRRFDIKMVVNDNGQIMSVTK